MLKMPRKCACPEGDIGTGIARGIKGHYSPLQLPADWDKHDCSYVRDRNSLIPEAEAAANAELDYTFPKWREEVQAELPGSVVWHRNHKEWSRLFCQAMDRLYAERFARKQRLMAVGGAS